ncbi:MAG: AMP-binding protein [Gammaproteobacteria bacterium]|nr:AMP-binding protein [Gammaproteobacteria bacterium]
MRIPELPGTLYDALRWSVERNAERSLLAVPPRAGRDYLPDGWECSYTDCLRMVERLIEVYKEAGYGHGHRIALCMDNRPEHFVHMFALGALGASLVPVNPDYRPAEAAYLLDHSEADLVIAHAPRAGMLEQAIAEADAAPPLLVVEEHAPERPTDLGALPRALPGSRRPAPSSGPPGPGSEASLLYTSGTTGRPKGCLLSHEYELAVGSWYATVGGALELESGNERLYNPLPLYHVNAGVVSFLAMLATGGCQIQPDRFHPSSWWQDVTVTDATIIHYLGVVAPLLLNQPRSKWETAHRVRLGVGAGIEPTLHAEFEARFGFPMIELWGMTEAVRVLADSVPPRQVGTRAFGRPVPGLEARVVDDADEELPRGQPGELVVRHSAQTPRKHMFSGYLKDETATEQAWRGGWFHTGDTVVQDPDGMLHFVDRKKNIIRRSGENIAAAEVEAVLQAHEAVSQVAVLAVPDAVREEEVMACIVIEAGCRERAPEGLAAELFEHVNARLAYYKAPGWILFMQSLPTTGTQKIQKHMLFAAGEDPSNREGIIDLRSRKRR